MAEHVILFTGPMGAGKTTAIESLSEIEVVRTEANNSERHIVDKATTTVALDYGEILIGAEEKVRLYGIPGPEAVRLHVGHPEEARQGHGLARQQRRPGSDRGDDLLPRRVPRTLRPRRCRRRDHPCRRDAGAGLTEFSDALERTNPGLLIPVFTVDPRDGDQMQNVLLALIANIEMRAAFGMLATTGAA